MLLLRSSVNASPMYLFRTLPPDVTRAQANRFRDMDNKNLSIETKKKFSQRHTNGVKQTNELNITKEN